ncbi:MAG: hypothetical protein ACR2IE_03575 [Candidatus Sumerlaeaceae bacterium]
MLVVDHYALGCTDNRIGYAIEKLYHGIMVSPKTVWKRTFQTALIDPVRVIRPGTFFPNFCRPFPGGAFIFVDELAGIIKRFCPGCNFAPVMFHRLYTVEVDVVEISRFPSEEWMNDADAYLVKQPDVPKYHDAAPQTSELFVPAIGDVLPEIGAGQIALYSRQHFREYIASKLTALHLKHDAVIRAPDLIVREDVYREMQPFLDERFIRPIHF